MPYQATCVITDLVYDIRMDSFMVVFCSWFSSPVVVCCHVDGSTGTGENSLEAMKIAALLRVKKRKALTCGALVCANFFEKNFKVFGDISPGHLNRLENRHVMVYGLMYET